MGWTSLGLIAEDGLALGSLSACEACTSGDGHRADPHFAEWIATMRRTAALLLRHGGGDIPQALSDALVCPLSKKPLRYCEASGSLVSDAVGVSFPIVARIPCLVPKGGKLLEDHQEKSEECGLRDSSTGSEK